MYPKGKWLTRTIARILFVAFAWTLFWLWLLRPAKAQEIDYSIVISAGCNMIYRTEAGKVPGWYLTTSVTFKDDTKKSWLYSVRGNRKQSLLDCNDFLESVDIKQKQLSAKAPK